MARNLIKLDPRSNLILTERDKRIIRAIYRYRFLTTDQIMILTGSRSQAKINNRVPEFWGNNYLDRPEIQRQIIAYADTRPTIQALGSVGATWLTDNDGVRFPKSVNWRTKNKNIKSGDFILHTLGVTETMLQVLSITHHFPPSVLVFGVFPLPFPIADAIPAS